MTTTPPANRLLRFAIDAVRCWPADTILLDAVKVIQSRGCELLTSELATPTLDEGTASRTVAAVKSKTSKKVKTAKVKASGIPTLGKMYDSVKTPDVKIKVPYFPIETDKASKPKRSRKKVSPGMTKLVAGQFAKSIIKARGETTQKAAAEKVGISLCTWKNWEQGRNTPNKFTQDAVLKSLAA